MADKYEDEVSGNAVVQAVISNVTAWTPAASAISPTSTSAWYVRRGNMLKAWGTISFGAVSGSVFSIPLPTGLTVDTNYIVTGKTKFGSMHTQASSIQAVYENGKGFVIIADTTQGLASVYADYQVNVQGSQMFSPRTGTALFNPTNVLTFEFEVPIAEWAGQATVAYGAGQATASKLGLVYDRKEYVVGTAYTNGTPAFTNAQGFGSFAVARGVLTPYQTVDGAWRLTFNIVATFTSQSFSGTITSTISGVTFKNTTNYTQAISGSTGGTTSGAVSQAFVNPNAGTVAVTLATGTISSVMYSGDVELNAKPTWAD